VKKLQITVMFWFIALAAIAQENWTLRKDDNGIAVYSRMLSNEKYKEIRVTCEFNATAEQLIKILQDVNHHKEWVYKTTNSYLISKKNKDTLYYYSVIALPWPVSNRDAAVQLSIGRNHDDKNITIMVRSIPSLVPKKSNLIRIPNSLGTYMVTALPNNHIKIDYTLTVDPGGTIPAWLVNYTATVGPYNTFLKLKQLVERKE
jgi:hypothetical protein